MSGHCVVCVHLLFASSRSTCVIMSYVFTFTSRAQEAHVSLCRMCSPSLRELKKHTCHYVVCVHLHFPSSRSTRVIVSYVFTFTSRAQEAHVSLCRMCSPSLRELKKHTCHCVVCVHLHFASSRSTRVIVSYVFTFSSRAQETHVSLCRMCSPSLRELKKHTCHCVVCVHLHFASSRSTSVIMSYVFTFTSRAHETHVSLCRVITDDLSLCL